MGEYYDQLDITVAEHLSGIRKSIDVPDDQEALVLLAKAWVEKEEAFARQIPERRMEMVEVFDPEEDEGGVLLLTYSGSLLTVGPLNEGARSASYASIGLRKDVPDSADSDDSVLKGKVKTGEIAEFEKGPIQKSSRIYKMAVFSDDMEAEEEEDLLAEVTQILAEDFAEVNRTIISGD